MSPIFATFLLSFKAVFRNLKSSAIIFILPIVFLAIFGLAFGGNNNVKFSLGIYQPDQNEFQLTQIFKEVSDNNKNIKITVKQYNEIDQLKNAVEKKQIDIGLSLPKSISNNGEFEVLLSQNDASSQINSFIILDIIDQAIFKQKPISKTIINSDKASLTRFDLLAPGLIIYGLIILIPSIARSFSQISEKNYVFRYSFSKISAVEIILGNVLFYFFLGVIQTILLYYTATLLGYHAIGNIFVAIVPALLTLFFVIALGLIIGSLFKKSEAATNTGTIINIILGFFSGAFIAGIGSLWEFKLFGATLQFNDIFPTKWGTVAMEKILTNNLGLADIQKELGILAISGIITLSLGIWIYASRQLKYLG
jgi:ABC-2 type transport system permease protein